MLAITGSKVMAGAEGSASIFGILDKETDASLEFKEILELYSLRLTEETNTKRISYKKDKSGRLYRELKRIYESENRDVVIEFVSALVRVQELSPQDLQNKLERTLVCRRIVWAKTTGDQHLPFDLQIGKDSVSSAIEKVNDRIVSQDFDGNRSGYVNFYFPMAGGPSCKLYFDFGVLSKYEQFY